MSDFFLNKEVDAYGRQNGKRHPKHSSKGGPFTERRILPEQEYIKHEPEYRCKGKNNQKKKKVKDFVPPLQEQKEVLGESMKELLDGRLLADTVLRKNIGFILFLTFLGIVYIANGYATEKLYMKKVSLERELGELRFESITTASELMRISIPSEVERRIQEAGLDLVQSKEPPTKIMK